MTPLEHNADSATSTPVLEREARLFCRYLLSREPSGYEIRKYVEGHRSPQWVGRAAPEGIHARLLSFAVRGPFMTRLADGYASVFHRGTDLRRKLVLLLAILESGDRTFDRSEADRPLSPVRGHAHLIGQGLAFAGVAALAMLVFLPTRFSTSRSSRSARRQRPLPADH